MNRTVSSKYRDPYRNNGRRRIEPSLSEAGKPTRFVVLYARECYRGWDGESLQEWAAEFIGHADGWHWNGTRFPTLLRAVRAALEAGA